jgi:hypothetical protein
VGTEDWLKRNVFYSRLESPSEPQGELISWLMTAYNAQAHDFTLAQVDLGPEDWGLEVGFGGGALAQKVLERAPRLPSGASISLTLWYVRRKRGMPQPNMRDASSAGTESHRLICGLGRRPNKRD